MKIALFINLPRGETHHSVKKKRSFRNGKRVSAKCNVDRTLFSVPARVLSSPERIRQMYLLVAGTLSGTRLRGFGKMNAYVLDPFRQGFFPRRNGKKGSVYVTLCRNPLNGFRTRFRRRYSPPNQNDYHICLLCIQPNGAFPINNQIIMKQNPDFNQILDIFTIFI
jgi:hypothetical protein